jgi:hypothetical protein
MAVNLMAVNLMAVNLFEGCHEVRTNNWRCDETGK